MRLKSLFVGTLLASLCVLGVSFLFFQLISNRVQRLQIDPTFNHFDELQLESARDAYESGGKPALSAYIDRLNHTFSGDHYFLNASGVDLLTGENRSSLLPAPPETQERIHSHGRWIIAHRSA